MMSLFSTWRDEGSSSSVPLGTNTWNQDIRPGTYKEVQSVARTNICGVDLTDISFTAEDDDGLEQQHQQEQEEVIVDDDDLASTLDVLVFPLPTWCGGTEGDQTCDMGLMGIGWTQIDEDGNEYWDICSGGAAHVSRWYNGYHTTIAVPSSGPMESHVKHGLVAPFEHGGRVYKTMIANCNPESRTVHVSGEIHFHCEQDPIQQGRPATTSVNAEDYVPVPYGVVTAAVFLFCFIITFRIRCNSLADDYEYEEAEQSEV